jgi:hypothetical protein
MFDNNMVGDKKGTLYIGLRLIDGYELISDDKIAEELFHYVGKMTRNQLRHLDCLTKVIIIVLKLHCIGEKR